MTILAAFDGDSLNSAPVFLLISNPKFFLYGDYEDITEILVLDMLDSRTGLINLLFLLLGDNSTITDVSLNILL
jgi:hypothetical protein